MKPGREKGEERQAEAAAAPQRKWVWMDKWDPGTWQMPENPTPLTRVLAGVALIIVLVMTIYLPLKIIGFLFERRSARPGPHCRAQNLIPPRPHAPARRRDSLSAPSARRPHVKSPVSQPRLRTS